MTYNHNSTLPEELVEQIAEQGFDYLPELIRIMINAAMQAERQKHLGVGPYERSQERRDYANGYKPKTMKTRMGEITFDVRTVQGSNDTLNWILGDHAERSGAPPEGA